MFSRIPHANRKKLLLAAAILLAVLISLRLIVLIIEFANPRGMAFIRWMREDTPSRADLVTVQQEACPGAPFILPAEGFVGLLYADPRGPYSNSNPHQGIDIFSNTEGGITPVYAAYDGYVTRENDWQSTLIQRIPDDPLQPGRQIWLYYTHMADEDGNDYIVEAFQPGTKEVFVERGTVLGYTGNFNGGSIRDIWVHLHFSIILDDGNGNYTNELEFQNSVDPSPYMGLGLSYSCTDPDISCSYPPKCESSP